MSTHNTTFSDIFKPLTDYELCVFAASFEAGTYLSIVPSFMATVFLMNSTHAPLAIMFSYLLMPFAIGIILGGLVIIANRLICSNNSKKNATVKNARNPKTFNDLMNENISVKLSDKGPVTKQQITILKNMSAANMITEKDIQPLSSQTLSWLRENRTFFESSHTPKGKDF